MTPASEFRDIPLPGRIIIIAIAVGVFAVAGVAVATSYNAVYRLVTDLGLYGDATNKTFGIMLDIAFIIAELAAILGGIMRAVHLRSLSPGLDERARRKAERQVSRGWPWNTMLVCGAATIAFNIFHAFLIGGADDPKTVWRCVVASFPPVLMVLSFQVLIAIVKWVMLSIGRPLNSAAALSSTAAAYEVPPGATPSISAGVTAQTGRTDLMLGSSVPKIEFARQLCRGKGQTALARTDGPILVRELASMGVTITPSEAWRAISEVRAEGNGGGGS